MASPGGGTKNTQAEALRSVLSNIADMKTFPDADMPYLIQLETMILGKLRQPIPSILESAYGPQPGAGGGGAPPQMTPGPGGMGVSPGPGGGVNGVQSMPSLPPVDEIRRMLSERTNR